ncbi:MAG TPA: hypothetical protein DCS43_08100 [Verrucomicrobia bacterium]|nr:hypothetical protein [Verrucomicrobiota bacterium]
MQASEILLPARRELQDEFGGKWPDSVLFAYIADGLAEMLKLRPDLLLSVSGTMESDFGSEFGTEFVRTRNGHLEIWDSGLEKWVAVAFENGSLVAMDGEQAPEGADVFVRLRSGRLEIRDSGLDRWIAVSFVNGALVPLLPDAADDYISGVSSLSGGSSVLSGDSMLPIDDHALVAPLVSYVVYRSKQQYAADATAQAAALVHYQAYRQRLGVDNRRA